MEWATLPFKKYADFSGRARRKEYWLFTLLVMVISFVLSLVEAMFGMGGTLGAYGPLTLLFGLAILIPSIAVGVRRLHDIDRSGWWLLIGLIPIVGFIALIVFFVQEGTQGDNRYGPDPLAAERGALSGTV